MRSGRITRRHFIQSASALGLSATAISSALRANPARAQDASKVTFWTTHTEPDLSGLQKIVDNFNSENSDVQAELVQVVGDETDTTKLMTAVRGGTGPDVYMLDRFIVAQRAAEGVLQDLSEFMGGEDFSEIYIPFAWAEANFQGKPYALPFDTDARALFYNKGMLQEAGIDPAELDVANGPITLDRLAEIANQLNETDQDGNFSQMGFAPYTHQAWHYTYGFAFGGTFFDEAACEVTPDEAGVVAGHQWLYDYTAALDPQKVNAFAGPYAAGSDCSRGAASRSSPSASRSPSPATGSSTRWRSSRPTSTIGMTVMPVPKEGDRVGDLGRRLVGGHPAGRQEPRRRLEVHAVHRGRAGATDLHHGDRPPADDQHPARGRQPLRGPERTSSSPSSCCRPRRTARRCRWERATGTS